MASSSRPYHHGDLRSALVEAALEMSRGGGPSAVSLREVTRRVGVSPSAAYRHFPGRTQLVAAVARDIQERMAARMRRRMRAPAGTDAQERALQRLRGVGLGYIAFAADEPGWFETAFFGSAREERADGQPRADGQAGADGRPEAAGPTEAAGQAAAQGQAGADGQAGGGREADGPDPSAAQGDGEADGPDPSAGDEAAPPPFVLLTAALDECVQAGVLPARRRPGAEFVCWSAVHGCAELMLHGPLRGAPRRMAREIAERVVDDIISGIRGG